MNLFNKIFNNSKAVKDALANELDIERTINYFATSLFRQNTVEDILWDITKNCITHLGFEDCIVYLLDEERNVLVQKSAYGPKNPQFFKIFNPIEIPVGQGIVGWVAQSGEAEIIGNTSLDPRYICDDVQRFSEITVPVIFDEKVIGVIDAEHSEKNFFTESHLRILTTIASLCANKIARVQAEEIVRAAELQMAQLNRELAEAKIVALRQQMNPHFLFNALNSINHYLLQGNSGKASELLTQFSRLIRQILENARTEWITLEQELKALKLYVQLETTRFDNRFCLEINISPELNPLTIQIPTMLLQPLAEKET